MNTFIKKIRVEAGLSQKELGKYLKLTQGEISHLERGRRMPSINTSRKLIRLAKKFDIHASLDNFYLN